MKRFLILLLLVSLIGCKKEKTNDTLKEQNASEEVNESSAIEESNKPAYLVFDKIIRDLHGKKYEDAVNYVEKNIIKDTDLLPYDGNIFIARVILKNPEHCKDIRGWFFEKYAMGDLVDGFENELEKNCSDLTIIDENYKKYSFQGLSQVSDDSGLAHDLNRIPTLFGREYNNVYIIASSNKADCVVSDVEFVFSNLHYDVVSGVVPYNTYGKDYSDYSEEQINDLIIQDVFVEIASDLIEGYGKGQAFTTSSMYQQGKKIKDIITNESDVKEYLNDFSNFSLELGYPSITWVRPSIGTITLYYCPHFSTDIEPLTHYQKQKVTGYTCVRLIISFDTNAGSLVGPFVLD